MKQLNEKFKRTVKYWRVSYQQATERERLSLYMFALLLLIYTWWAMMVF